MRVLPVAVLAASLLNSSPGLARVFEVRGDGTGDATTIQGAIDLASAGDLVRVACGVYPDCSTSTPFGNACLVLKSGVDLESDGPGCAVVDAAGAGLLVFAAGVTDVTIRGFVFRGTSGGFSSLWVGTTAELVECRFEECEATGAGGAMTVGESPLTLTRCEFVGNQSPSGGAIFAEDLSTLRLEGCWFADNSASRGGAVYCENRCDAEFLECVFLDNRAGEGAAAFFSADRPTFTACTFTRNESLSKNAVIDYQDFETAVTIERSILADNVAAAVGRFAGTSLAAASCCAVVGNGGGDYAEGLAGQEGVDGNVSVDPRFCDPGGDDFALQWGSPCLPANSGGCGGIGAFGPGGCVSIATDERSWSRIKASFR